MNQDLRQINDKQLLCQTRELVTKEREVLTHILNHLREVERRKLFCDFRCQSLFEFTVKELKYSEGQACRRISAMRLMNEFSVEVKQKMEKKIASGSLSLSNVSQAQSFFREARKRGDSVAPDEKLEVLQSLEDKSAREGQKVLIRRNPLNVLSKKGEKLTLPEEIANKLEEFRALLGAKGAQLSLDELIGELAQMGIDSLKAKKFGKKRSQPDASTFVSGGHSVNHTRRPTRHLQFQVWNEDQGKCRNCGNQRNLNIDHIKPVALGGKSTADNLRLLCFHCNQREAMKVFGVEIMERARTKATKAGRTPDA